MSASFSPTHASSQSLEKKISVVSFDVPTTSAMIGSLINPAATGDCVADPDTLVTESNEADNDCTNTVTVEAAGPNLIATKSNDLTGNATAGVAFEWEIEVLNDGDADAEFDTGDVVLVDDLPTGATYANVLSDNPGIDCTIASNTMTCEADSPQTLNPGDSLVVTLDATPAAAGTRRRTSRS